VRIPGFFPSGRLVCLAAVPVFSLPEGFRCRQVSTALLTAHHIDRWRAGVPVLAAALPEGSSEQRVNGPREGYEDDES